MLRNRPRLQPTLITCSRPGCHNQAIRYYPSRASTRRKLSPRRYCSTRCGRLHWEERQRQQRAEDNQPYPCENPNCNEEIWPTLAPGRPRDYCTPACKARAKVERERRQPGGAVLRARATARFLQREAKWAAAEAKDLRLDLGRWLARFEQAQREVEAHPTKRTLMPEVIEKRRGGMLRQARLDDAAALKARKARAAVADLRRSEDRLARRAADARRRRAKGQDLGASHPTPSLTHPAKMAAGVLAAPG